MLLVATGFTLLLGGPAFASPNAVQATFYADPNGSGSTCSSTSPCSLEGARDKVRTVNGDMTGDIVVKLRDGVYNLDSPLQLTESVAIHDSGTNGFDIVYTNDAGAVPVLSGGEYVSEFTLYDATKGIYKAGVPAGTDSRQLYVDGQRAIRARSAGNPGFAVTSTGYTLPTTGFYSSMGGWGNIGAIEVATQWNWKNARLSVASISGSAMTMDGAGWNDENTQPEYAARGMSWLENAYELLDADGEWYLDRSTNTLYYKPRAGEDMSTSEFVLGRTVGLVSGTGTGTTPLRNVVFNGLSFAYDGWTEPNTELGYPDFQGGVVYRGAGSWFQNNHLTPAGVTFTDAHDVVVRNSTFEHMANAALAFGEGTQDCTIDHNVFDDISGNGINLGAVSVEDHHPTDPSAIVRDNVISNNLMTRVGAEYRDNVAIFVGYTQGTDIRHNTLHNLPYTGISMGWGWGYIDTLGAPVAKSNVVRGNLIYDFMKIVPDGGAVYTLGSQPGSSVVDNYSYADHNVYGYLYRDNGSAGFHDTNNVISDEDAGTNTWYRTNTGSGGYWNAHDNLADANFFSSTLTTAQTGGSNVVTGNTSVANRIWPAAAQAVINNAGIDGGDITPVAVGEVPISRGKTATASSTASATYAATKAIDGDSATRWMQSGTGDPSWLKVDLGDSYEITSTRTIAELSAGLGVKYKIEHSLDDVAWSPLIDKTANTTVPGRDVPSTPALARYLKITFTDSQGQAATIAEFDVFGTLPAPVSQGKAATASSIYSSGFDASKAVDGDTSSRWAQQAGAADPSWLKIDLGSSYQLTRTETAAYMPSGLGMKYKIEYSSDGSTWSTYVDKTSSFSTPGIDANAATIDARYVRITLTGTQGQGGSIYEFKVFGEPSTVTVTDVAHGKPAAASSSYSAAFDPSKAVDADTTTRWAQQSGAADPSWLKVDLGVSYRIDRTETAAYLPYGLGVKYKIEYSSDNTTWSTYVDRTAAFSTPGMDVNPAIVDARYIRVTLVGTQGQGGSIYGFEVYGNPIPPPEIAQGKTATASSQYSASYAAAKAVDGDPTTRWAQQSGAADPSWIKIDLGASYRLNRTTTTAYLPYGVGVKYKIEYSLDDANWSTYVDKTASFSTPGTDTNTATIDARYVKLTLTGTQGQGGSIYEFKVYGTSTPVPEIAQGKTATASSVYSASYPAAKAVDADPGTRWAQQSGAADPSWLKVDLGATYQLDRTETVAFLPSGLGVKYKVEYSLDDTNWSVLVDKTAAYSMLGVDAASAPVAARYVRITLTATQGQGGSIYEFKVFGQ